MLGGASRERLFCMRWCRRHRFFLSETVTRKTRDEDEKMEHPRVLAPHPHKPTSPCFSSSPLSQTKTPKRSIMASHSLERGGRRRAIAMMVVAASCCVVGSVAARSHGSRRTATFAGHGAGAEGRLDAGLPGTGERGFCLRGTTPSLVVCCWMREALPLLSLFFLTSM